MTVWLRRLFLIAMPLAVAGGLLFHPPGGDPVYEGVRSDANGWQLVHILMLFAIPLMALAVYLLLNGMQSRVATVARVSLVFFTALYTAWEVTVGLGTGILVDYANDLPAAEQAVVADAIQDYNRNNVIADPSIAWLLGSLGWMVALVAAAVAYRRAGAGWPLTLLIGAAALFAVHPPPIGPIALVCFAAAAGLIERARASKAVPTGEASPAIAVEALTFQ